jgi:hypothetical protein
MAKPVEEMARCREFGVEGRRFEVREAVHPPVQPSVQRFDAFSNLAHREVVCALEGGFAGQQRLEHGSNGGEVGLPGVLRLAFRAQLLKVAIKPWQACQMLKSRGKIHVLTFIQTTLTGAKRPSCS